MTPAPGAPTDAAQEPGRTVTAWAVVAVVLASIGAAATLWRPLAPALPPVATDLDAFAPAVLASVDAYRSPRVGVVVLATLLPVVVPLLAVTTGTGRRAIRRLAGGARPGGTATRAAFVAVALSVATSLSTLPLAAWARLIHDGRWGFRTQGVAAWFRDWLVVSAGRWVMVAAVVAALMGAVRRWPRSFPYRLTVAATVVAASGVMLHPVLLLPVVLPMTPLTGPERTPEITRMLAAAGEPDLPLYVGEESRRSTRVNALATGLGPTARVVLHDNLLELPPDQVASVLAHEVAHHQHHDLLRGVLSVATVALPVLLVLRRTLGAPTAGRLVGARGPGDVRLVAVVLLVAAVLALLVQPVTNLVSRRLEAAADARAVELTGDPATLIASTRVFTVRDLSDPEPARWTTVLYRTHPSVGERIRRAVAVAERDGRELPSRHELERAEHGQRHPASLPGGGR